MTRKDIQDNYQDEVCSVCPFFTEGLSSAPGAICEGRFCDEAIDTYCDEYEIKLEE